MCIIFLWAQMRTLHTLTRLYFSRSLCADLSCCIRGQAPGVLPPRGPDWPLAGPAWALAARDATSCRLPDCNLATPRLPGPWQLPPPSAGSGCAHLQEVFPDFQAQLASPATHLL